MLIIKFLPRNQQLHYDQIRTYVCIERKMYKNDCFLRLC